MGQLARRLVVLGSTGSIGTQTLSVVRSHPDSFDVIGLGTGHVSDEFLSQVREFKPTRASVAKPGTLDIESCETVSMAQLAASADADLVVVAIPGLAALEPTLAAIEAGNDVALASKEVLVVAGGLVMAEAAHREVAILPLDSEHNAIWQCTKGEPDGSVAGTRSRRPAGRSANGTRRSLTPSRRKRL